MNENPMSAYWTRDPRFKTGVFEITVNDETAYWYGKACLLSFKGKLYCTRYHVWEHNIWFVEYLLGNSLPCMTINNPPLFGTCNFPTLFMVTQSNPVKFGNFNQNHLHNELELERNRHYLHSDLDAFYKKMESLTQHFLKQDQLTPRILTLQRFARFIICRRNVRKHLLAVLLTTVPIDNSDVARLIAAHL